MPTRRRISQIVTGLPILLALGLIIDRGGLLAWCVFVLGIVLLAKVHFRPSDRDLMFCSLLIIVPPILWSMTLYYVISTYESGEVVELTVEASNGPHTARVWIFGANTVYYDAEPEVAASLLAGKPLQLSRAGSVSVRNPEAIRVDAMAPEEAAEMLAAMAAKYGDRMVAADVYYLVLGRPRDRIALVIKLA